MKRSAILAASLFAFVLAKSASANVLYNQPSAGNGDGGYYSEANGPYQYNDNFTLAGSGIITNVLWIGGSQAGPVSSFGMSFFANNSGVPGTLLSTFNLSATGTDLGPSGFGSEVYLYDSNIPAFSATGGTQYWISIFDYGTAGTYYWNQGTGGDGVGYDFGFGPVSYFDPAYTLFGSGGAATPEPSSLVLAGSGILTLAGALRRRIKR